MCRSLKVVKYEDVNPAELYGFAFELDVIAGAEGEPRIRIPGRCIHVRQI